VSLYLLDTNILSDLIRNPSGPVAQHVARIGETAVITSIVVAAELRYGAAKRGSSVLSARVEALLTEIRILAFDVPTDRRYAALRTALETAGMPIGGNDLIIAAQALAAGATVVTANAGEFRRVPGLPVENWLADAGARDGV
jgi:tRNA(fMet)-specific endonuclease VapC